MIEVNWDPIRNPYDVHGILLGYRVFYTAVALSKHPFDQPMPTLSVTLENPPQTSVVLRNLSAFTRYHIQVLAFTIKGDGVKSPINVAGKWHIEKLLRPSCFHLQHISINKIDSWFAEAHSSRPVKQYIFTIVSIWSEKNVSKSEWSCKTEVPFLVTYSPQLAIDKKTLHMILYHFV